MPCSIRIRGTLKAVLRQPCRQRCIFSNFAVSAPICTKSFLLLMLPFLGRFPDMPPQAKINGEYHKYLLLQIWEAAAELQPSFAAIDRLVATNLKRVQQAFATAQVAPHHFAGSTGYGHGDLGRDALDRVSHNTFVKTLS